MLAIRLLAVTALALLSASNADPRAASRSARHTGRSVRSRTDAHLAAPVWHETELVAVTPNLAGESSPFDAAVLPVSLPPRPALQAAGPVSTFQSVVLWSSRRGRSAAPRAPPLIHS